METPISNQISKRNFEALEEILIQCEEDFLFLGYKPSQVRQNMLRLFSPEPTEFDDYPFAFFKEKVLDMFEHDIDVSEVIFKARLPEATTSKTLAYRWVDEFYGDLVHNKGHYICSQPTNPKGKSDIKNAVISFLNQFEEDDEMSD